MARHNSGELRCPATALIIQKSYLEIGIPLQVTYGSFVGNNNRAPYGQSHMGPTWVLQPGSRWDLHWIAHMGDMWSRLQKKCKANMGPIYPRTGLPIGVLSRARLQTPCGSHINFPYRTHIGPNGSHIFCWLSSRLETYNAYACGFQYSCWDVLWGRPSFGVHNFWI